MKNKVLWSLLAMLMMNQSLAQTGQQDLLWDEYGGPSGEITKQGTKYSEASQITPENVSGLELYMKLDIKKEMGENFDPSQVPSVNGVPVTERRGLQLTPLFVNDRLYGCSNFNRVFSADVTDMEHPIKWIFTPPTYEFATVWGHKCRGVSYWENPEKKSGESCRKVIFSNTIDGKLYAVDADNGKSCSEFGENGTVDLRRDISSDPKNKIDYSLISAPHVYRKGNDSLVVVGGAIWDNKREKASSGVVRAYSAATGKNVWSWDPIPASMVNDSGEKFYPGTPNSWAPMASDENLGLIYVPMGNAAPDLFSGQKGERDHYASSMVAIEAKTGKVRWHFKEVKFDVWDYDSPAQPALFDWKVNGVSIPAIAIGTKMGYIFILDRRTGAEIPGASSFGIKEVNVATQFAVPGETPSPTQIAPPGDYAAHGYPATAETLVDPFVVFLEKKTIQKIVSAGGTAAPTCLEQAKNLDYAGIFTPPSLKGAISFPGPIGGIDWGGVSIDPDRNLILFNQNHVATVVTLLPREQYIEAKAKGMSSMGPKNDFYDMDGTPYGAKREIFASKVLPGMPCTRGPWGSLNAIDLNTGKFKWRKSLGSTIVAFKGGILAKIAEIKKSVEAGTLDPAKADQAIAALEAQIADLEKAFSTDSLKTFSAAIKDKAFATSLGFSDGIQDYNGEMGFGLLNLGGLLTTKTGITAIGAAQDQKFRIYRTETGELLKEFPLAKIGSSTPMTFVKNGVQYLVIGAGGNALLGGTLGDDLMIYKIKEDKK